MRSVLPENVVERLLLPEAGATKFFRMPMPVNVWVLAAVKTPLAPESTALSATSSPSPELLVVKPAGWSVDATTLSADWKKIA